jgi:hypothetical protein
LDNFRSNSAKNKKKLLTFTPFKLSKKLKIELSKLVINLSRRLADKRKMYVAAD